MNSNTHHHTGKAVASHRAAALHATIFLLCALVSSVSLRAEVIEAEVCIYGGTCGGIAAAIQSSRMGNKVVLAEFSPHLGGLTTGGLGATDIGNKGAIGGISREFYSRIAHYYSEDKSWKF